MTDPGDLPPIPVQVRPEIAALRPYRQGQPGGADAFKLSSNENPFDPLPSVSEAYRAAGTFNRYPDATAMRLTRRIARWFGVSDGEALVGAGSVALLTQLVLATCAPGDELMFAWRSFEAYPGLGVVAGATCVTVPLDRNARHDLPAMAAAVTDRTRAILVCSPNNPTGPAVHRDEFFAFVEAVPKDVLIVLDEAYTEFITDPDAIDGREVIASGAYPNVVVLRTFSKAYGLAGLRVGYAIGNERILDAARSTAIPLSTTAVAEESALASLDAEAELRERVTAIVARRDRLVAGLRSIGWDIPDAQGNFVWFATGEDTETVAARFLDAGLVTRAFPGDGIRVSVGEDASVDKILQTAQSVVGDLPHLVRATG